MFPMKFRQLVVSKSVMPTGRMIPVTTRRGVSHEEELVVGEGKKFWHYFGWNANGHGGWCGPIRNDPATFRAYTGQIDMNRKEIYVGDIVELHCSTNEAHVVKAVIEWNDETCMFFPSIDDTATFTNYLKQEMSAMEVHRAVGMHYCLSQSEVSIRIIGNTDENPELLNPIP